MTDANNLIRRRIQREQEHNLMPTPSNAKQKATIPVRSIKVAVPLPADAIPQDIVPPDGFPAGEPVLEVVLEGGEVTVAAKLNGKTLRRNLKLIAEHGAQNVAVVLQGALRPGCAPSGALVLSEAGLQVVVKQPKAEDQVPQ